MPRKYLRITEVTKICGVDVKFVARLEREKVVYPIVRRSQKLYPPTKSTVCVLLAC